MGPESSATSHSDQLLNPTLTSPLLSESLDAAVKKPPSASDLEAPSVGHEHQEDVCTDSVERSIQKEQIILENEVRTTDPCESPEPFVNHPRLSLFSGMELINRGKLVCLVEPVLVDPNNQSGVEAFENISRVMEKSSERTAEPPTSPSGKQVSAFSFLNL